MKRRITIDDWKNSFIKSKAVKIVLETDNPRFKDADQIAALRECFKYLLDSGKKPDNGWFKTLARWMKYDVPTEVWRDYAFRITERTKNGGSLTASSLNDLQLLYGAKEGRRRWEEYKQKQAKSNTYEYKKERHGWTEEQFHEYNKSRSVTLKNCIRRHGEERGLQVWRDYCDKQAYTNTLEYFIEREGSRELGLEFFLKYNQEKRKSQDPKWIMEKYSVSFNEALEILSSRHSSAFVSEGEKYFISELEEALGKEIKYTYKTRQFCVWSKELNTPLFYDIVCTERMKAIEYNEDYWHANPKLYDSDYFVKKVGLTAEEIWKRDQIKIQDLITRGFEVKIVWENDFLNDLQLIKEIIEWIQ